MRFWFYGISLNFRFHCVNIVVKARRIETTRELDSFKWSPCALEGNKITKLENLIDCQFQNSLAFHFFSKMRNQMKIEMDIKLKLVWMKFEKPLSHASPSMCIDIISLCLYNKLSVVYCCMYAYWTFMMRTIENICVLSLIYSIHWDNRQAK